jgi:hypothetical protein
MAVTFDPIEAGPGRWLAFAIVVVVALAMLGGM